MAITYKHLQRMKMQICSFYLTARDTENERGNFSGLKSPPAVRSIEAGSRYNYFPGETRIHLNYAGVVSFKFYDTVPFPSLKPLRHNKERWDYRLERISSEDVETLLKALGSNLDCSWDRPVSGIDRKTLLGIVVDRYVVRLQILNRLLNSTVLDSEADPALGRKHCNKTICPRCYRHINYI